jgi:hypothetical protein
MMPRLTARQAYIAALLVLAGVVSALTLIELLRVPAGACAVNAGSAACARQRVVILLPWAGMGVAVTLYVRRMREPRRLSRTVIPARRRGKPLARLAVIDGPPGLVNRDLSVSGAVTIIGRDPALADILLYGPRERSAISGRHCTIRFDRGLFTVTDDGSTNGTQVNGVPLMPGTPAILRDGDEITLGDAARHGAVLRFQTALITLGALPSASGADVAASPTARVTAPAVAAPQPEAPRTDDPLEAFFSHIESRARRPVPRRRSAPPAAASASGPPDDPGADRAWIPDRDGVDDSWMRDL